MNIDKKIATRQSYGEKLVELGEKNKNIVVLDADLSTATKTFGFMFEALVERDLRTLPFGLYAFVSEGGAETQLMMAASTIIVVPMIILFLFARKQIVNGVARGGLKG